MDATDIPFRDILENLGDAVCFLDRSRRVRYWNAAAEQLTGYTSEEVVGRECLDGLLLHVDTEGRHLCGPECPVSRSLDDGEPREMEIFLRHKQGHRVPVLARVSVVRDPRGQRVGALEVFADNSARRKLQRRVVELNRLAMLDALTELPNRRYMEQNLASHLSELARFGWRVGVLFLDIDHFKDVNDRHGHEVGDRVLAMVARTLSYNARVLDVVGRWGGEEFLVILPNADAGEMLLVAERLRTMVERSHLETPAGPIRVTVSIGAVLGEPGDDVPGLIRRADHQLYAAKHGGRNRVCTHVAGAYPQS